MVQDNLGCLWLLEVRVLSASRGPPWTSLTRHRAKLLKTASVSNSKLSYMKLWIEEELQTHRTGSLNSPSVSCL